MIGWLVFHSPEILRHDRIVDYMYPILPKIGDSFEFGRNTVRNTDNSVRIRIRRSRTPKQTSTVQRLVKRRDRSCIAASLS